jgi:hypothetical protein
MRRAMEMKHWLPEAEAELSRAIASPAANRIG